MTLFHNGRGVIRLGDKTDHGGVVVSASGFPDMGKAIALVGDMAQCPKCKGTFPIATGVSTSTFMGKPMAYHGDKTACGATLISSWGTTGMSDSWIASASEKAAPESQRLEDCHYDQYIILEDQDGNPLDGIPYKLSDAQGAIIQGATGADGKTTRVAGHREDTLDCEIAREAKK